LAQEEGVALTEDIMASSTGSDSVQAVPRSTKNLQCQAKRHLTKLSHKIEESSNRVWLAKLVSVLSAQLEDDSPAERGEYESQMQEAFVEVCDEVRKQRDSSLAQVNLAMQLTIKQANKLALAIQEVAPPDQLLTAAKGTELKKKTFEEQQHRNELRESITQGCQKALADLKSLWEGRATPDDKLEEERLQLFTSCGRLAVHGRLATDAASLQSTLEVDLNSCKSKIVDETKAYMQPIVNNLRQNLNAMEEFLDATVQSTAKGAKASQEFHEGRLVSLRAKEEKYAFADVCPEDDHNYKQVLDDIEKTKDVLEKLPKKGDLQMKLLDDLRSLRSDLGMFEEELEEPPKKRRKFSVGSFTSWMAGGC